MGMGFPPEGNPLYRDSPLRYARMLLYFFDPRISGVTPCFYYLSIQVHRQHTVAGDKVEAIGCED